MLYISSNKYFQSLKYFVHYLLNFHKNFTWHVYVYIFPVYKVKPSNL